MTMQSMKAKLRSQPLQGFSCEAEVARCWLQAQRCAAPGRPAEGSADAAAALPEEGKLWNVIDF